jgi:hypothetical protein
MGVVLAGHSKDYIIPKFSEMLEHVVYPDKDVDVVFAVDEYRPELVEYHPTTGPHQILADGMKNSMWATEIVYYGKEALRKYALDEGYDSLIWQGIDCLYENAESFQQLKRTFEKHGGMVGGLVAGRNRPDYPVCRDFVWKDGKLTKEQKEIPELKLATEMERVITVSGYPGSDATFVSRYLLENVTMKGYEHWHLRPNKDEPLGELGPEEWFVYRMIKDLKSYPLVESRCRPQHVHENLSCSRYPGQTCSLSDLKYS